MKKKSCKSVLGGSWLAQVSDILLFRYDQITPSMSLGIFAAHFINQANIVPKDFY